MPGDCRSTDKTPFRPIGWLLPLAGFSVTSRTPRCTQECRGAFERHIQRCWLHRWSPTCTGLPRMERGRLEGANKVLTNREFSVQKLVSTWKCSWSSGRALGQHGSPLALALNAEQFRGGKHEAITGAITRWALNCRCKRHVEPKDREKKTTCARTAASYPSQKHSRHIFTVLSQHWGCVTVVRTVNDWLDVVHTTAKYL